MKIKFHLSLLVATALLLVVGLANASGLQVEAGSFNGAAGMTHKWEAAEFGTVSAEADEGSAAPSLAARYSFGTDGGLKFSAGLRGTSTEFTAGYGEAAQAAYDAADATVFTTTEAIMAFDADGNGVADDEANAAALQAAYDARTEATEELDRIASAHKSDVGLSGFNVTAMKEHTLADGKSFAYGYEGFQPFEEGGKLVNAARIEYGSKQGSATWNVVGNVGDGWAGAGVMIGF